MVPGGQRRRRLGQGAEKCKPNERIAIVYDQFMADAIRREPRGHENQLRAHNDAIAAFVNLQQLGFRIVS